MKYCRYGEIVFLLLAIFFTAASALPAMGPATSIAKATPGILPQCSPPPVTVPPAAPIPGEAELDPTTGLHYTGSGKPVVIELKYYRLEVSGMVDYPLSLSYDQLRCLPKIEARTTIVCKGNFDDTAVWAGASLKYLLELAGIQGRAKNVRLVSADGYENFILRKEAMSDKAFLAYEWEKKPVPIIHGFPVRAALPGLIGANWVKWLVKIEAF